jgi:hypothetical protein
LFFHRDPTDVEKPEGEKEGERDGDWPLEVKEPQEWGTSANQVRIYFDDSLI